MQRLIDFIIGSITVKISGKTALDAVNRLKENGKKFSRFRCGDGCYYVNCNVFWADRVLAFLEETGAEYEVCRKSGLPFTAFKYKARLGLLVGAALAMLIVYSSTLVIWEVQIECNGEYDKEAVENALASLGVKSGKRIGEIDVYETELMFLVQNPSFSDMALNIQGTVAVVKLRIRTESPRQEEKDGFYNVVACESGVIQSVSAIRGVPVVKKGDTVEKGDMLISGTVEGRYGEIYLYHAYGSVKASVYRDFFVCIPLVGSEKQYTGESKTKTSYKILGKSFDMFISEFSPYESCDAETESCALSLWSIKLPIIKESVIYKEYTVEERVLSQTEAEEEAKAAFLAYLEREAEGDVLRTEYSCEYNEALNAMFFKGTAEIIAEIGTEVPAE